MRIVEHEGSIPMERWWKDHPSLLAYLDTCAVDNHGLIDIRRMGCNVNTHPLCAHMSTWNDQYGTRAKDVDNPDEIVIIKGHDDWDVAEELAEHGFLEFTMGAPAVFFTERGALIAGRLRAHKAMGGNYCEFDWFGNLSLVNKELEG